jgi:hypothetical protein
MIARHHSKWCFDFRQSYSKAHRQLQEALCPLYSMPVAPVTVLLIDRGPNKEEQANPFE